MKALLRIIGVVLLLAALWGGITCVKSLLTSDDPVEYQEGGGGKTVPDPPPEPQPKADDDRDSIPNSEDDCPSKHGPKCFNGCPLPDKDRDCVADSIDRCDTLPGASDNNGCPLEVVEIESIKSKMRKQIEVFIDMLNHLVSNNIRETDKVKFADGLISLFADSAKIAECVIEVSSLKSSGTVCYRLEGYIVNLKNLSSKYKTAVFKVDTIVIPHIDPKKLSYKTFNTKATAGIKFQATYYGDYTTKEFEFEVKKVGNDWEVKILKVSVIDTRPLYN